MQFTRGMSLDEQNNADFLIKCAHCYVGLGNFQMAEKYYLRAIKIDNGKQGKYYYMYALFLCQQFGDLRVAKIYCLKAIKFSPNYFEPYYQYAEILRDFVKDYKESQKYFLKALQMSYSDGRILGSYGYLLYLMGDYENARKYVEKALEMNCEKLWSHLYLGLLNKSQGNVKIVEKEFLRAVELTRDKPSYFGI